MEIKGEWYKRIYFTIAIFWGLGWIIYSPMCTNYFTHGDGVASGLVYKGHSEGAELGRIGIAYVDRIMGRVVSPSFNLVISLCILAITVLLIFFLFKIEGSAERLFIILLTLLQPNLSSIFTYYYCMVSYLLALLCGVVAAVLVLKIRKNIFVFFSGMLVTISLTLYQAYLSVMIVICMIYVMYTLIQKEDIKCAIIMALKSAIAVSIGVGGYLLGIKIMNVPLTENRSFSNMGKIDFCSIDELIGQAYHNFFDYFFGDKLLNNSWMGRRYINGLIITIIILEIVAFIIKEYSDIIRTLLLIGIVVVLPIGFELTTIIAPDVDLYGTTAMVYLYYMPFIFYKCLSSKMHKRMKVFNYFSTLLIVWNLTLFTYAFENVMWLNYNKTMAICQKISTAVDAEFGYYDGMKIMVVGSPEEGNYPCNYSELLDIVKGTLAVKGMSWKDWLQCVCYLNIWKYYQGICYTIPTSSEYSRIVKSQTFLDMDIFPNGNSIEMIDDIVVIKLGKY